MRPANPIYNNFIARWLIEDVQTKIPDKYIGQWMDGAAIRMNELLEELQKFWAVESEPVLKSGNMLENFPQFALHAFIHKVANGGARIIRERSIGLGRADIVVQYAQRNYVIELKIKENETSRADSLNQLLGYMDRLGEPEGWLLVFYRQPPKRRPKKRAWESEDMKEGRTIHVFEY